MTTLKKLHSGIWPVTALWVAGIAAPLALACPPRDCVGFIAA